jgi:DNA-binding response OmpR family regulator
MAVLIVEDHDDAREMLALLLQNRGFRVGAAGDGESGVEQALDGGFAAAVVDIGLPGCDGYEVARRLRADERCGGMLLVALSGYGSQDDHRRSLSAGFDHHLVKPVEPDELCALLRSAGPP